MYCCSSYGAPEGVSDLCYHCKAKVHNLVGDMRSPLPSDGDRLPNQAGGNMDNEDHLCNMNGMDPCTDLSDTLYTSRINASTCYTGFTPVTPAPNRNKRLVSCCRGSKFAYNRAVQKPIARS
jgi:hypothetical protein